MRTIKRYSNRKLYDTETKQYITLDEMASLIRDGYQLQVLDNATGEDLTTLTLSQIILEQEKKHKGFLPRSVLNALVESGGKSMNTLRTRLESPLDLLKRVDEEIEQRIQALIQRGELAEEHGQKLRDQLLNLKPGKGTAKEIKDEEIEKILTDKGVPNQSDIRDLLGQIETLSQKISHLDSEEK
jgi:polyhydroxyalkanoate synthesis repressor PhaR